MKPPAPEADAEEVLDGLTFTGERFAIPETPDVLDVLKPRNWRLPQVFIFAVFAYQVSLLLQGAPVANFVVQSIFWRLAYNAGLGLLLHAQSRHSVLTAWVERTAAPAASGSLSARVLRVLVPAQYDAYPAAFRAWMVFRCAVDVVLGLDVAAFVLLCFRCWEPVDSLLDVLAIVLGLAMCVGAMWVKMDAHKVVGDYAWHWGDFFFRKEVQLVFGGVFNMFPHPMYTVAYAWYYGLSFITRSPTVGIVGALCHLAQIAFLVLVETPHMDKIYPPDTDAEAAATVADMVRRGFQQPREPLAFLNLDWTDAASYGLVLAAVYVVALHCAPLPAWAFVAHAVAWRLAYSGGLGCILHAQSTRGAWTRAFVRVGKTHQEAFAQWKRLFNLALTLCYLSFVLCAVRLAAAPQWASPAFWLIVVASVGLGCLQYWASTSTWAALGAVGYFYGDFFIEGVPFKVSYAGIYRYSNNPDSIIGYSGLYAVALLSQSPAMAAVALFSQLCHFLFLRFVEMPHVKKLYGTDTREHGGLWTAVHHGLARAKDARERDRLLHEFRASVVQLTHRARRATVEDLRARIASSLADLRDVAFAAAGRTRLSSTSDDEGNGSSGSSSGGGAAGGGSGGAGDADLQHLVSELDSMSGEIKRLEKRMAARDADGAGSGPPSPARSPKKRT